MPITDISFYRRREDILAEMLASLTAAIPDAYTGEDGVTRIIFDIESGQLENLYLAHQLLLEDIFVTTASQTALIRHGEQYGLTLQEGLKSSGTLRFEGDGGTYIPLSTEVGYDPGGGLDVIYFETTSEGYIPNPGDPAAPTVAINVTAGNLNGSYEYTVTFLTASGESLPSPESAVVAPVNQQVNLTVIPLGGPNTTGRRIYRDKNGAGTPRMVTEITNNTVTTFTDNVTDATVAAATQAPTVDTAHRITVNGQSQSTGVESNVGIGTITLLTSAPSGLTTVYNPTAFTGASDPEDTNDFRLRLLQFIRAPGTGSPQDLQAWAENVDGVESATVFPNTPAAGQVTVRISGVGGTIPSAQLISDVQAALSAQDLANITITVAAFTAVPTNVTVDVTTSGTYVLADVTAAVQAAITNYINELPVGGTLYLAGIIDSVFGLAGIADVVVTTPATNQTTAADSKRTPGTITVT
jgi:uncharacterized phage protein gp47/JayE